MRERKERNITKKNYKSCLIRGKKAGQKAKKCFLGMRRTVEKGRT